MGERVSWFAYQLRFCGPDVRTPHATLVLVLMLPVLLLCSGALVLVLSVGAM